MTERVPRNGVPEQRSDFLRKGTERGNRKGTEQGKERRSKIKRNERNGDFLQYFTQISVINDQKSTKIT